MYGESGLACAGSGHYDPARGRHSECGQPFFVGWRRRGRGHHRAAGPELLAECRTLHGCKTGEAKLTRGYNLPAAYVIHTVGPRYYSDEPDKPGLLASCYRNSLRLAQEHGLHTVAFPSISTGAYGYPLDEAAHIAVRTVMSSLASCPDVHEVTFVCFGASALRTYESVLKEFDKKSI